MNIKAVIVDIEGTISPIEFVKEVLFPYSYEKLPEFLKENRENPEIARQIEEVKKNYLKDPQAPLEAVAETLRTWIREDKKYTPLKAIQGFIWEEGYRTGQFKAPVYDDAFEKMNQWKKSLPLYVYSSGSIKAQKLFFAHTDKGDITSLFAGFFDTTTGNKKEPASYRKIAEEIRQPPEGILFITDSTAEVEAARSAGIRAVLIDRYSNPTPAGAISTFYQVEIR